MNKYNDNHFTPSDHNAISRIKNVVVNATDSLKINSKNNIVKACEIFMGFSV